ncbi:hypothetical protein HDU96_003504 [Phlyctochytrium bullatum]|nr:hypothetical protein HDU96_003504 [Phlyctochytrium bullatum]
MPSTWTTLLFGPIVNTTDALPAAAVVDTPSVGTLNKHLDLPTDAYPLLAWTLAWAVTHHVFRSIVKGSRRGSGDASSAACSPPSPGLAGLAGRRGSRQSIASGGRGIALTRSDSLTRIMKTKTITPIGGIALLFNNMTGIGLTQTSQTFQESGWLMTSLLFLLYMVIASLSALFIVEAMQAIPGNKYFQGTVEFGTLINFYFGPWAHIAGQMCLYGALQSNAIASIIQSAQTVDNMIMDFAGSTCGLTMSWTWKCVTTRSQTLSPFGDTPIFFSYGYLTVMIVVIPMCLFPLAEYVWVQIVSFILTMCIFVQWITASCVAGLDPKRVPVVGPPSGYAGVVGVVMLNYAFIQTVPAWVNCKKPNVNVQQTVWTSTIIGVSTYIVTGIIPALAFDIPVTANLLTAMAAKSSVNKVFGYLFSLLVLMTSIPVMVVISHMNLTQNFNINRWVAAFGCFVVPWIASIPFQTGSWLIKINVWSSLIFISTANFIVPLCIYLKAVQFRRAYNKKRVLSEKQRNLLRIIHLHSSHPNHLANVDDTTNTPAALGGARAAENINARRHTSSTPSPTRRHSHRNASPLGREPGSWLTAHGAVSSPLAATPALELPLPLPSAGAASGTTPVSTHAPSNAFLTVPSATVGGGGGGSGSGPPSAESPNVSAGAGTFDPFMLRPPSVRSTVGTVANYLLSAGRSASQGGNASGLAPTAPGTTGSSMMGMNASLGTTPQNGMIGGGGGGRGGGGNGEVGAGELFAALMQPTRTPSSVSDGRMPYHLRPVSPPTVRSRHSFDDVRKPSVGPGALAGGPVAGAPNNNPLDPSVNPMLADADPETEHYLFEDVPDPDAEYDFFRSVLAIPADEDLRPRGRSRRRRQDFFRHGRERGGAGGAGVVGRAGGGAGAGGTGVGGAAVGGQRAGSFVGAEEQDEAFKYYYQMYYGDQEAGEMPGMRLSSSPHSGSNTTSMNHGAFGHLQPLLGSEFGAPSSRSAVPPQNPFGGEDAGGGFLTSAAAVAAASAVSQGQDGSRSRSTRGARSGGGRSPSPRGRSRSSQGSRVSGWAKAVRSFSFSLGGWASGGGGHAAEGGSGRDGVPQVVEEGDEGRSSDSGSRRDSSTRLVPSRPVRGPSPLSSASPSGPQAPPPVAVATPATLLGTQPTKKINLPTLMISSVDDLAPTVSPLVDAGPDSRKGSTDDAVDGWLTVAGEERAGVGLCASPVPTEESDAEEETTFSFPARARPRHLITPAVGVSMYEPAGGPAELPVRTAAGASSALAVPGGSPSLVPSPDPSPSVIETPDGGLAAVEVPMTRFARPKIPALQLVAPTPPPVGSPLLQRAGDATAAEAAAAAPRSSDSDLQGSTNTLPATDSEAALLGGEEHDTKDEEDAQDEKGGHLKPELLAEAAAAALRKRSRTEGEGSGVEFDEADGDNGGGSSGTLRVPSTDGRATAPSLSAGSGSGGRGNRLSRYARSSLSVAISGGGSHYMRGSRSRSPHLNAAFVAVASVAPAFRSLPRWIPIQPRVLAVFCLVITVVTAITNLVYDLGGWGAEDLP